MIAYIKLEAKGNLCVLQQKGETRQVCRIHVYRVNIYQKELLVPLKQHKKWMQAYLHEEEEE